MIFIFFIIFSSLSSIMFTRGVLRAYSSQINMKALHTRCLSSKNLKLKFLVDLLILDALV